MAKSEMADGGIVAAQFAPQFLTALGDSSIQ
jgi:hypothetical protein